MTTHAAPADSARSSISTPPSLPPPTSRSLGHLRLTPPTPCSRRAVSAHTPMTRPSAPRSCGTSRNAQLIDRQTAPPGGASQARPRRPRPAFWYSASSTSAVPLSGLARSAAPCWSSRSTRLHRCSRCARAPRARAASRIFAGSSGSLPCGEPVAAVAHGVQRRSLRPRSAAAAFHTALRLTPSDCASSSPEWKLPSASAANTRAISGVSFGPQPGGAPAHGLRSASSACSAPRAEQPQPPRARLGARAHARDVGAVREEDEECGQDPEGEQAAAGARERNATASATAPSIEARPTNPKRSPPRAR